MTVQQDISLEPYNTFGIDVKAKRFVSITSNSALTSVLSEFPEEEKFILGGGSNMLLTQDMDALVLHINLKGKTVVVEDENTVQVKVSAGENWHEFVLWCIDQGYGGVENLSLIPGNVGTSPIQNIGAYGVELKDVFVSCEAFHLKKQDFHTLDKADCKFSYRDSVFKQNEKGNYIITNVTFQLTKNNHRININYGAIKSQLKNMKVVTPTIKDVSDAVTAIRQSKLPDPKEIGNSGSFFKNPVIPKTQFESLLKQFPDTPNYPISENEVKVPAGWLIETAGFKGKTLGNYGVHKKQALVLVNYGNAKGKDILNLARLIQKTIKQLFGITIETEVNVL